MSYKNATTWCSISSQTCIPHVTCIPQSGNDDSENFRWWEKVLLFIIFLWSFRDIHKEGYCIKRNFPQCNPVCKRVSFNLFSVFSTDKVSLVFTMILKWQCARANDEANQMQCNLLLATVRNYSRYTIHVSRVCTIVLPSLKLASVIEFYHDNTTLDRTIGCAKRRRIHPVVRQQSGFLRHNSFRCLAAWIFTLLKSRFWITIRHTQALSAIYCLSK